MIDYGSETVRHRRALQRRCKQGPDPVSGPFARPGKSLVGSSLNGGGDVIRPYPRPRIRHRVK